MIHKGVDTVISKMIFVRNLGYFRLYALLLCLVYAFSLLRTFWIARSIRDISEYELYFGLEGYIENIGNLYFFDSMIFLTLLFIGAGLTVLCILFYAHVFVFDEDEVRGTIDWAYYGKRSRIKYVDINEFGVDADGRFFISSENTTLVTAGKVSQKNQEKMKAILSMKKF